MVIAYVLVSLSGSANASRIAKELLRFEEIGNLHLVYGEWDLIARVKAKDMISLREFTLDKLLRLNGIGRTNTLIVADEQ